MLHIMDVSRWQGRIDWDKVKASGIVSGVMLRTRRTLRKSRSKEDIMGTTYDHFVDANKMCAAQEQFRNITKMVTKRHRFAVLGNMVRNAGQLPQPFWIGAHGGGSRSAATVPART